MIFIFLNIFIFFEEEFLNCSVKDIKFIEYLFLRLILKYNVNIDKILKY